MLYGHGCLNNTDSVYHLDGWYFDTWVLLKFRGNGVVWLGWDTEDIYGQLPMMIYLRVTIKYAHELLQIFVPAKINTNGSLKFAITLLSSS